MFELDEAAREECATEQANKLPTKRKFRIFMFLVDTA